MGWMVVCSMWQRDTWKEAARAVAGHSQLRSFQTRSPACVWTNLLGTKLLFPSSGTQQGPEGFEEPPPRPVLDRQEHGHVLPDAL